MDRNTAGTKRDCGKDTRAARRLGKILNRPPTRYQIRKELESGIHGMPGRPRTYPDCVIIWIMMLKYSSKKSYREITGDVEERLVGLGLPPISPSQLYSRGVMIFGAEVKKGDVTDGRVLAYGFDPGMRNREVTVAVDATGMSLNSYGGWMAYKWNKNLETGWIKIHAAVDVDSARIIAWVITDESCGDTTCFERLVELLGEAGCLISTLYADAAYDTYANWELCRNRKLEFIPNIKSPYLTERRKGGRMRSNGHVKRLKHIRRILKIGRELWKIEVGYGRRWRVEGTFSDFKRKFGDKMVARCRERMANDICWRIKLHNLYKTVREIA